MTLMEKSPVDSSSSSTLAEMHCVLLENGDLRFSSKEADMESGRPRFLFVAQRAEGGLIFKIFDIHQLDGWALINTMVDGTDDDDDNKEAARLSTDQDSFVGSVNYEKLSHSDNCRVEVTDKIGRPVAALVCEHTGFRKLAQDVLQRAFCCYPPAWETKWAWDFLFCNAESAETFSSALDDMSSGRRLGAGVKLSSSGIYTASSTSESSTGKAYVGTMTTKGKTDNHSGNKKDMIAICMEDEKMDGRKVLVGFEDSVVTPYQAAGFVLGQLLVREARGPRLTACQLAWRCFCLPLWLAKMCLLLAVFFVIVAAVWHYLIYVPFHLDKDWAPAFPWNWNW